jgi:hypothetical protein
MKDFINRVGNNAKSAVESGIYVFCLVVAVGMGWKLGSKVIEKVEKKLEEK